MSNEKKPKVFLSYSWAIQEWVIELATRLMNDGVETKVDFWDLKEGQDKYKFMESMVNDDSIDFVLIVCDDTYTSKANSRTNGVGDETVIISSKLYGNSSQTKFLPLVLCKDDRGEAILPTYIETRIYFDFSDERNHENEYERLLRRIYNKPLIPKPKLGNKPEWLSENSASLSSISSHISILKSASNEARKNAAVTDFYQDFASKAKEFVVDESKDLGAEIFKKIEAMKPLRDSYLDFLKEIILSERSISGFVCDFFEKVYNELMLLPSDKHSWYPSACDHYKFLIWEMFVCTIAYLRHYEEYKEIHTILTHTYFLQSQVSPHKEIEPCSILNFRCYSDTLDNYGADQHKHSFTADIAVKRVKEPLITKETFAETDIFICQMSFALKINEGRFSWFPSSYLHANNASKMWIKLSSRQYCTKILPLFNAKSIDELKRIIQCNPVDANYKYSGAWYGVPAIPLKIGKYGIGELN